MSLDKVDHVAAALARLPSQFRGLPGWEAAVTALVTPLQDTEAILQDLLVKLLIDNATGALLTLLGKLVKQPRDGVTDDTLYRRYVRARIAANNSGGTRADNITVARLILGDPAVRVYIREYWPAAIAVDLEDAAVAAATADIVASFVHGRSRGSVSAAVGTRVTHSAYPPAETFRLGATTYAETVTAGGSSFWTYVRDTVPAFPQAGGLIELRGPDGGDVEHTEVIEYASFAPVAPGNPLPTYYHFNCKPGETIRYGYVYKTNPFRGGVDGALVTLVEQTVQRGVDAPVYVAAGTFDVVVTAGATYTVTVPLGYYTARQFAARIERALWLVDPLFACGATWDAADLGWRLFVGRSAGTITVNNFSNTTSRANLGFSAASHGPGATVIAPLILATNNGGRLARNAVAA